MMKTFLQQVIERIYKEHKSFDDLVFVLPNKRAGLFLKRHIAEHIQRPIFSPVIYSIEEMVVEMSALDPASNLDLLLGLYEVFLPFLGEKEADFESFIAWGHTLLSDFNEIDRNLVSPDELFNYLTANQRLKYWGADEKATPFISNTLKFWGQLKPVYENFQKILIKKRIGHQGLLYREAVSKVENYISEHSAKTYQFIGFNALNTAEEYIFQRFSDSGKSVFWWDIDSYFLNDSIHEAGFFIRNYLNRWPNNKTISSPNDSFLAEKNIEIIGVPKSISQAKFSAHILNGISLKSEENDVALVLSDETLLKPVLNSLPPSTDKVNITMGLPLRKTVLFDFFDALFNLHLNVSENGWFHKDVSKALSNPYAIHLINSTSGTTPSSLHQYIKERNILFVDQSTLKEAPFSKSPFLEKIFNKRKISAISLVALCLDLIGELKEIGQELDNQLEFHALYGFFQLFNQLESYVLSKPYLRSIKAIRPLFNELVSTQQIDFRGEPLGGLQIMGVLESRNLDFETVIITSVNEGILPAGKNQNSFIPFDIKKEFGLPTYKEKDAIYAYHFYRLLQRAKNIHILYNTEPDILQGNEKSRYISQLLTDLNVAVNIDHTVAAPENSINLAELKTIQKTPVLLKRLREMAEYGFSPSSLTNYIRNPYGFYMNNVLRLDEVEDVEENIAHNTFGTIVHDSLEELYTPLIGNIIVSSHLNELKEKIASVVRRNFERFFLARDIEKGQNFIAFHVIQKYLSTFVDLDIKRSQNHEIRLLALEKNFKEMIPISGCPHPVFLKGKLDRLEQVDGRIQILDYKTGNVDRAEVELMDLKDAVTNEKQSKAFQLLCYALMVHKEENIDKLRAGIVPIKKLSSGILLFAQKQGPRGPKEYLIEQDLLTQFQEQLSRLILEILNPELPFEASDSTSF